MNLLGCYSTRCCRDLYTVISNLWRFVEERRNHKHEKMHGWIVVFLHNIMMIRWYNIKFVTFQWFRLNFILGFKFRHALEHLTTFSDDRTRCWQQSPHNLFYWHSKQLTARKTTQTTFVSNEMITTKFDMAAEWHWPSINTFCLLRNYLKLGW